MEPIDRVVREFGDEGLPSRLAGLGGADFTTLLLDVFERRADATDPATVMRRRVGDRFVRPSPVDGRTINRVERTLLDALPETFETVVLSPLAPLGAHASVASVAQNRIVSTARSTEVAADPTVGLAIEAAMRRRALLVEDSKSAEQVRLAAIQRIVRAQQFDGPMSFPHFTVLGLVTAGRDTGSHRFEAEAMEEHALSLASCLLATGADHVTVTVTDWTGGWLADVADRIRDAHGAGQVTVTEDPARTRAKGYYRHGSLEVGVRFGDLEFSAADGGLVDWTQTLLSNRKERLMISGIGVDRIALATG